MPEYLSPGVYIEEVSYRSKAIEGVSTTTTGFVGATRYGPVELAPDVVTSLVEFEHVYGDRQQLHFASPGSAVPAGAMDNYLWHAARAYFEEGGKRLYVARVFQSLAGDYPPAGFPAPTSTNPGLYDDGHARASVPAHGTTALSVRARFPGAAGNMRVRFTVRLSQNVLSAQPGALGQAVRPAVNSIQDRDVVWIHEAGSPPGISTSNSFYLAESFFDATIPAENWRFHDPSVSPPGLVVLANPPLDPDPAHGNSIRILSLTVTVISDDPNQPMVWDGLALDPAHQRAGTADSATELFDEDPANLGLARTLPIVVSLAGTATTGIDVLAALLAEKPSLQAAIEDPTSSDAARSVDLVLSGGNDGRRPLASDYEGTAQPTSTTKSGLRALEDIDDIAIVAAPGSTLGYEDGYRDQAATIQSLLIGHATAMRYRIAILDSGDNQSIANVRSMRGRIDSTYAALYYPWVRVLDPVTRREINLPPSGFVAGIYARNDVQRAVFKAPANEVVTLALGFETSLNRGQQDVLNPEGVNCFRFFEGRGYRLWGTRLASSDPEWKYVNLRRYFAYLEHSIDRGTQWAVFEPNGPSLWDNVRRTIDSFLFDQWQTGALLGDRPEAAYFVRCDRSTMTQNDLDNGRLVCLIGVALVRPAEFVVFRIGQWTASSKS